MDGNVSSVRTLVYQNRTIVYGGVQYFEILAKLNHARMLFQLPVIVILMIVMMVATFGNILVISVYRITCKSSVASFFITLLAVVDLTTALCISFNIQDMLNPYMNPAPIACKTGRFLESFTAVLSGNILVCIAFDRYVHIVYPLRRYSFQQAKSLAIVMTTIALSLSWPQLFLSGKKTVKTPVAGIFGEDCSFQDGFYHSIYTLLFQGSLAIAFFTGLFVIVFFYSRVYYVIWRRRREIIGEQISTVPCQTMHHGKREIRLYHIELENRMSSSCRESTIISVLPPEYSFSKTIDTTEETEETEICHRADGDTATQDTNINESKRSSVILSNIQRLKNKFKKARKKYGTKDNLQSRVGTVRITRIMAAVTIAGMFGYLPFLIVNILKTMGVFFKPDMSPLEDLVYEFCTKSHFLNTFANPVIYSAMNPRFRGDVCKILTNLARFCCFKERL